ncbi:MAG TPA: tetratricopeptide repeat protein, partial [Chroococcales cyanobacterium]
MTRRTEAIWISCILLEAFSSGVSAAQTSQPIVEQLALPAGNLTVTGAHSLAPLEGGGLDGGALSTGKRRPSWNDLTTHKLVTEGIECVQDQRLDEAMRIFQEVLQRDPKNTVALNNLAVCQKKLGQIDEAIANLNEAIENNPTRAELHNNLATAYMAKGNLEEA